MKKTCLCCGKPYNIKDYVKTCELLPLMQKNQLCFSCAFWTNLAENPKDNQQIIDGKCYQFEEWDRFNSTYVEPTRYVLIVSKRIAIKSNHMKYVGKVPDFFEKKLPNTAKLIDKSTYHAIQKNQGYNCQAKGCWDRYHCLWYNMPEPDGPWNKVPARHRIGDEFCPIFIQKSKI